MIISSLETLSQTTPMLILPSEINGSVQLDISAFSNLKIEKSGYEYLSVFVKNEAKAYNLNAIQGRYKIAGSHLVFTPYFPFERGMTYVVRTKNTDEDYSYQSFQVEKKQFVEAAKVASIYPLANELPENLLRFYIYFNTPMKKGQALKHIQLVDNKGNIDNHAFMEFKQELWSADGKRLTILFDPGRIKRGVSTNVELGPALLEGKHYQLRISDNWKDVHNQNLAIEFTKEFEVVQAYREQISVKDLEILKPNENSFDSLSINFNRIMDHALIQSMIQIMYENSSLVAGHWEISQDEMKAIFFPEQAWKKGSYRLIMDGRLEDVSGNNLNNLLDQKINANNELNLEEISRMFKI